MQRRVLFGVMQTVFGAAVLACFVAPGFAATNVAATKTDIDLRKHPTDGKSERSTLRSFGRLRLKEPIPFLTRPTNISWKPTAMAW